MPRVIATITAPACPGCCGTLGFEWSCESLTGEATLCGITGYRPDGDMHDDTATDAPWQYRKWSERELAGSLAVDVGSYAVPDCGGSSGGFNDNRYVREFTGTYTVVCGEVTYATWTETWSRPSDPDEESSGDAAVVTVPAGIGSIVASPCPTPDFASYYIKTQTLTLRTVTGCGCDTFTVDPHRTYGTATEELLEEQYLYDALAEDPEAVAGESCCTELTEGTIRIPESTDDITLAGTAVRVRLHIINGDPEVEYPVCITTFQDDVDIPSIEIYQLAISGGIPVYWYVPLPEPGDYPICVVSVVQETCPPP